MNNAERTPVLMTWEDYYLLKSLSNEEPMQERSSFADELNRAIMVQSYAFPPHAIRLYSEVIIQDAASGETKSLKIVPPSEVNEEQHCISVFDPLATAIFGFRQGESIEWPFPEGLRTIRIQEVKNNLAIPSQLSSEPKYYS